MVGSSSATTDGLPSAEVTPVKASNLVFGYGGEQRAVDDVSVELTKGQLRVVLGPNGSGKSTLLKLLCGLLRPQSGKVEFDGHDLLALSPRERARLVAVVPQSLQSIPEVRVRDFVLSGRYAHLSFFRTASHQDGEVVERALGQADAAEWGDRLLGELSGGERQRVLIARALAQDAQVLLLDEPTASLDPEHQMQVMHLVRAQADAGHAVMVVTHDFNLASQFGDRILLMHEGSMVARGTVDEVLCQKVLEPVYGHGLHFGRFPSEDGLGPPMVVPARKF